MYSRSHCLARMPKNAAARLKTRLMKMRALIHRAEVGGMNDGGEGGESVVLLIKEAKPFVRIWFVVSELSGSSKVYVSTTKAVSTAEKRPACHIKKYYHPSCRCN